VSSATSTDPDTATVLRFYEEVLNQQRLDVAVEITAPHAVLHAPFPDPGTGPAGIRNVAEKLLGGFPDLTVAVDETIAKDDKVVVRWHTTRQTHLGPYRGIPPTGKDVRTTAIQIFRMEEGKIAESWLELDQLGGARQMGVVAPEDLSSARTALFVLGSLGRIAFLEARHQIRSARHGR
jgi:predicted ester cyclase